MAQREKMSMTKVTQKPVGRLFGLFVSAAKQYTWEGERSPLTCRTWEVKDYHLSISAIVDRLRRKRMEAGLIGVLMTLNLPPQRH